MALWAAKMARCVCIHVCVYVYGFLLCIYTHFDAEVFLCVFVIMISTAFYEVLRCSIDCIHDSVNALFYHDKNAPFL